MTDDHQGRILYSSSRHTNTYNPITNGKRPWSLRKELEGSERRGGKSEMEERVSTIVFFLAKQTL